MNKKMVTTDRIRETWNHTKLIDTVDGYPVGVNDVLCTEQGVLAFVTNAVTNFEKVNRNYMIFLCANISQSPKQVVDFVIYHEIGHILQFQGVIENSDDYYLNEAYADQYAAVRLGISIQDAIEINRRIFIPTEECNRLQAALATLENVPLKMNHGSGMQDRGSDYDDVDKIIKGVLVVGTVSLLAVGISMAIDFIRDTKTKTPE